MTLTNKKLSSRNLIDKKKLLKSTIINRFFQYHYQFALKADKNREVFRNSVTARLNYYSICNK